MYLEINPAPKLRVALDTMIVSAQLPFNTSDIRLPSYPVTLNKYKPSSLYFGLAACPTNDDFPIPSIDPFQSGKIELILLKGKKLNKNLFFDFERTDTSWAIIFKLVAKQNFEGLYFIRTAPIQYKDKCIQIDPTVVLVNTPTSHNLIRERLNWQLSPYPNDVFFFVE